MLVQAIHLVHCVFKFDNTFSRLKKTNKKNLILVNRSVNQLHMLELTILKKT